MKNLTVLLMLLVFVSCTKEPEKTRRISERMPEVSKSSEKVKLLFSNLSAESREALKKQSKLLGLAVTGDVVVAVEGPGEKVRQLGLDESVNVIENTSVDLLRSSSGGDSENLYLAKKDFELDEFWKVFPEADGRGVIVGVMDDGISPHQSGFKKTTTGERKLLEKIWTNPLFELDLQKKAEGIEPSDYFSTFQESYQDGWFGVINESWGTRALYSFHRGIPDYNRDGNTTEISVSVFQLSEGVFKICVDTNTDKKVDPKECFANFSKTGEYGFWDAQKTYAMIAEFAPPRLKIDEGEQGPMDSHGEGVASVMAGHQIGGRYDGVAPGAQIIDYDFTGPSREAYFYTAETFLHAFEEMGKRNVKVVNVSYAVMAESLESQNFVAKAIEEISEKYNMVITYAAGNSGPALGSFFWGGIYGRDTLVVGAYVNPELDENVHGVTGLPEEGRLVWYSSVGPSSNGTGPMIISPLSSLSHSAPSNGFSAFAGTSSAAPAAGGLAAVLTSAIQQAGMEFDARALVHAIRLSGTALPDVPFVAQGHGLPKALKAFELYKQLVAGKSFSQVEVSVTGGSLGSSKLAKRGLYLKASKLKGVPFGHYSIEMKGRAAYKIVGEQLNNMLLPLQVRYSDSLIRGAETSWVGAGSSRIQFSLDHKLLLEKVTENGEFFGEVEIFDPVLNQKVSALPITVVDDRELIEKEKVSVRLAAQEGVRIHRGLGKSGNSNALRIKVSDLSQSRLMVTIVNDRSEIKARHVLSEDEWDVVFPIESAGHHQIVIARLGGTVVESQATVEMEPMKLDVKSKFISLSDPKLAVDFLGKKVSGKFVLKEKPKVIAAGLADFQFVEKWTHEVTVESGLLELSLENPRAESTYSDFDNIFCNTTVRRTDTNEFVSGNFGGYAFVNEIVVEGEVKVPQTVSFECKAFDRVPGNYSALKRRFTVVKNPQGQESINFVPASLRSGTTVVDFKEGRLDVQGNGETQLHELFFESFEKDQYNRPLWSMPLGDIELFD